MSTVAQVVVRKIREKREQLEASERAREALREGRIPPSDDMRALNLSDALFVVGAYNRPELIPKILRMGASNLTPAFKGACRHNHLELVKTIIRNYGYPLKKDQDSLRYDMFILSGVKAACRGGAFDVITEIMKNHFNTEYSKRVLYAACRGGSLDLVRSMITAGWIKFDENNRAGAYRKACQSGCLTLIQHIESLGDTDPNDGLTFVCIGGHTHLIDRMEKRGGKFYTEMTWKACQKSRCKEIAKFIGERNPTMWDEIYQCAIHHNLNSLIDIIPPDQIRTDKSRAMAMAIACWSPPNWEMIGQLIEDVTPMTGEVIMAACQHQDTLLARLILERADSKEIYNRGLYGACSSHSPRVLSLLVENGTIDAEEGIGYLQTLYGSSQSDPPVGIYDACPRVRNSENGRIRLGRFISPSCLNEKEEEDIFHHRGWHARISCITRLRMIESIIRGCRELREEWTRQIEVLQSMIDTLPLERLVKEDKVFPTPWYQCTLLQSEIEMLNRHTQVVECYEILLRAW